MLERESLLNPYEESFAINNLCGMQSKTLIRSVNKAPTKKLLSKFSFLSSIILMSASWVLYDFLYAAKKMKKTFLFQKPESLENFS